MSGIAGILFTNGQPVHRELLYPVLDTIGHYGLDDQQLWTGDSIGLLHCLKRVLPNTLHESSIEYHDDLVIVADVRIDNRDELFSQLHIDHNEHDQISDSKLILLAYQKWREDCVNYLIGAFAFVIWDKHERTLFCGRDHVGIRPLYYYWDGAVFAFASDIKGVVAFDDVLNEIDEIEIAHFMESGRPWYYHPERTFIKKVNKLLFGHWLRLSDSNVATQKYWFPEQIPKLELASASDYVEQADTLLHQALQCRLQTDLSVGSHLSGGIDSSTLTVMAARHLKALNQNLSVYSWSPPPAKTNADSEHLRIGAVLKAEGLTCWYPDMTEKDYTYSLSYDLTLNPTITMVIEHMTQQQMQMDGVGVVISGWGGDETLTFYGQGYRGELLVTGRWIELAKSFFNRRKWYNPIRYAAFLRAFWYDAAVTMLPDSLFSRFTHYSDAKFPTISFMKPDFTDRVGSFMRRPPVTILRTFPDTKRTRLRSYNTGHLTARLESWSATGVQNNISYHYPFLDRRVMEFAFSLPSKLFFYEGEPRYIAHRIGERYLPPTVSWRRPKEEQMITARNQAFHPGVYKIFEEFCVSQKNATQSNPWVDIDRLCALIPQAVYSNHLIPNEGAIFCALQTLAIWKHRNAS